MHHVALVSVPSYHRHTHTVGGEAEEARRVMHCLGRGKCCFVLFFFFVSFSSFSSPVAPAPRSDQPGVPVCPDPAGMRHTPQATSVAVAVMWVCPATWKTSSSTWTAGQAGGAGGGARHAATRRASATVAARHIVTVVISGSGRGARTAS
jgi:hypothetical protein